MKTILVLERETPLVILLRRVFKRCKVVRAQTAEQALRRFLEKDRKIDLFVSEVFLPTSSGIQVALVLRVENADLPVILMGGSDPHLLSEQDAADLERLRSDSTVLLPQSVENEVLLNAVERLTDIPQKHQMVASSPGRPPSTSTARSGMNR